MVESESGYLLALARAQAEQRKEAREERLASKLTAEGVIEAAERNGLLNGGE